MPPQTFAPEFARLDHSVAEYYQVRADLGVIGVSWIMADRQLEALVPRFPERARQILNEIERGPVLGNDPDEMPPICPNCLHTVCSGDCSSCRPCQRSGPIRLST